MEEVFSHSLAHGKTGSVDEEDNSEIVNMRVHR